MSSELTTAVNPAPLVPAIATFDEDIVLNYLGLRRGDPKAQALVFACRMYGFDPLLKHIVLIRSGNDTNIYVTRDGLLHAAHLSGRFNGMDVEQLHETQSHYIARCSVWRKDMERAFTFQGRYPKQGGNAKYGPEMAEKVAVCRALRHAFDVSLCSREETWEEDDSITPIAPARQSTPAAPAIPAVDANAYPPPQHNVGRAPRPVAQGVANPTVAPSPEPVTPPEAEPGDEADTRPNLILAFAAEAERLGLRERIENDHGKRDKEQVIRLIRTVLALPADTIPSAVQIADAIKGLSPWKRRIEQPVQQRQPTEEPIDTPEISGEDLGITNFMEGPEPEEETPPAPAVPSPAPKPKKPLTLVEAWKQFQDEAARRGFDIYNRGDWDALMEEMYGDDKTKIDLSTADQLQIAYNWLSSSNIKKGEAVNV